MRLTDLQVVLYLFYLLFYNENIKPNITKECPVVIVTKDRNFLEDAKKEHVNRRNMRKLRLRFTKDTVTLNGITIHVQNIDCKNYGTDSFHDLRCTIDHVNRRWAK